MAASDITAPDEAQTTTGMLREAARRGDSDWTPVGFSDSGKGGRSTPRAEASHVRWSSQPQRRSEPIATRPAGRIFTGLFLLALIALPVLGIWNAKFRYAVRGVVNGRVLQISAPRQGTVAAIYVREGEAVEPGQLLMKVTSLTLEHKLASIADELRLAEAELQARASQLTWQAEWRGDRGHKAWSEYYELRGRLAEERARLDDAKAHRERQLAIFEEDERAVSDRDLEAARFAERGQAEKVEKLQAAIKQLKRRAELYGLHQDGDDVASQHNPQVLKVESLEGALARVREQLDEGMIRSPVKGRVVRLLQLTGETTSPARPALEIVEDGSLEIVLYVPQQHVDEVALGQELPVHIDPYDEPIICRITRRGHRLEHPPLNIERHFPRGSKLLPMHAESHRRLHETAYLASEVKVAWTSLWLRPRSDESPHTPRVNATPPGSASDETLSQADSTTGHRSPSS